MFCPTHNVVVSFPYLQLHPIYNVVVSFPFTATAAPPYQTCHKYLIRRGFLVPEECAAGECALKSKDHLLHLLWTRRIW